MYISDQKYPLQNPKNSTDMLKWVY